MPTVYSAYPYKKMSDMISSIFEFLLRLLFSIRALWRNATSKIITMDTGKSVRLGRKIAEGGFSFVFEAFDSVNNTKYAIKRISVGDHDTFQATQREAGIHRSLKHPNLMPLLGMASEDNVCYLLFPYIPQSLRDKVSASILNSDPPKKPFPELLALQYMYQLLSAISAMHAQGHAHCDIKLENILLQDHATPVLMDFGSVSTLAQPLRTRKEVMTVVEVASQHTTLPYRPPELLDGHVRAGDREIDMTAVDVWSLGCTFFAMLYGASPFECEFRSSGELRIVECTQLKILGNIPKPPPHGDVAQWYSKELVALIETMLVQDRAKRPTVEDIMVDVAEQITKLGGKIPSTRGMSDEDEGDLDALLSSSRFV
jgi:serine/threonine kinase 16